MTQSNKTIWLDADGDVWVDEPDDDQRTHYGPFTEYALVPVETCTSVLDAAGFKALGVGAVVAQDSLKFTLHATGDWHPAGSGWDYNDSLLADLRNGVPLVVLDAGAPVELEEPTTPGARVYADSFVDSTRRVPVYRIDNHGGQDRPWVELDSENGQKYRVWNWEHLKNRNPSLTEEV